MNNNENEQFNMNDVEKVLKTNENNAQNSVPLDVQNGGQSNVQNQALSISSQNLSPQNFQQQAQMVPFLNGNINPQNIVNNDIKKINLYVQQGLISPAEGQNLTNLVMSKAKMVLQQMAGNAQNNVVASQNGQNSINDASEFLKNHSEILQYLKDEKISLDNNSLSKICQMVENVEKAAIDKYLQNENYKSELVNNNEQAKKKLTANAQSESFDRGFTGTFTREMIGKMSTKEFEKYEKEIMRQLHEGKIR